MVNGEVQDKNFIVSKYVVRLLSEKCSTEFIRQATRAAQIIGNPNFDGWVFELDVIHRIRKRTKREAQGEQVFSVAVGGSSEAWPGTSYHDDYRTFSKDWTPCTARGCCPSCGTRVAMMPSA
jgi:hypothetical protein